MQRESAVTVFRSKQITSAVLSPDGSTIASSSNEGCHIQLWQCEGGIHHYSNNVKCIKTVIILADGKRVTQGFAYETIMVWDAHTGECLESIPGHCPVDSLALTRATSLVVSSYGGQLRLWDYHDPHLNATGTLGSLKIDVRFSTNGPRIIGYYADQACDHFLVYRRNICTSPLSLRYLESKWMTPAQINLETRGEHPYCFSGSGEGWVVDRDGNRVCWIPPGRRSSCYDCIRSKLVIGSLSQMTIIDFSDVLF